MSVPSPRPASSRQDLEQAFHGRLPWCACSIDADIWTMKVSDPVPMRTCCLVMDCS